MQELPIIGQSPREAAVSRSGVEVRNPADKKMYPVPGQGVTKEAISAENFLPILSRQHLTTAPTLKSWLDSKEGKPLQEDHEEVIQHLKDARLNGAPININVNDEGFYDLAFSGANGNMVRIQQLRELLDAGLSVGECLHVTKLVCGPNGVCGNPGPCQICCEIRDGGYHGGVLTKESKAPKSFRDIEDQLDEEINLLVSEDTYCLHNDRIMNTENSRSAGVDEVKSLCRSQGKGVIYVLEMLGVYRETEAASNTAMKRGDLGGH